MHCSRPGNRSIRLAAASAAAIAIGAGGGLLAVCGPFTDVSDATFCPFVLEIFTLGTTTGTTPAPYDPAAAAHRLQMAAFLSRTVDSTLGRRDRRTLLGQHWFPRGPSALGLTTV